jgi:protein translocase SEC61 complex gamma subunit
MKSWGAMTMGIKSWLQQAARTLKLAVKPGREELWLSIKISILGIGAIGLIGFIIKYLAIVVIGPTGTAPTPTP